MAYTAIKQGLGCTTYSDIYENDLVQVFLRLSLDLLKTEKRRDFISTKNGYQALFVVLACTLFL